MVEWLQHLDLKDALKHDDEAMPGWLFWTYAGISAGLVTMAGLMSGLTLGLMSLDEIDLEVLKRSGTESEKRHAKRIMPVIANTHFLLVTLLLFNALSTEALPIFLDKLVDPVTAVVLSVSVVLVIGEILPQAVCRSFGLQVGSYSSWLVRLLMIVSSPISWPIGKFIDWLLGQDHTALFRRAQLKALVGLHSTDEGLGGNLTADEISIITGALDLTSKTAWTAMTPLDKVFMLAADRVLDESTLQEILISGHSRVPLHEPGDRCKLTGLILVKELVLVDPEQGLTAGQLVSRQLPRLPADTPMYQLLRLFEAGGSHMVALTKPPNNVTCCDMLKRTSGSGAVLPLSPAGKNPNPAAGGPLGLSRTLTPTEGLVKIKSGIIKTADREIYVEAEQKDCGDLAGSGVLLSPTAAAAAAAAAAGSSNGVYGDSGDGEIWGQGKEGDVVGIITIEDVIEELLQQEIIDETDQYVDNMQNMRVDAYALTTNLPPRLRKAYHQQFMPRVGRLVVHQQHNHHHHHYHHHMMHQHAAAAAAHGSSWPKGGSSEQQWIHMPQALYEGRVVVSNPATPISGSPPGGHYGHHQHNPSAAAAAAAAVSSEDKSDTPLSRFSSSSSMGQHRSLFAAMSPEHHSQQQQHQDPQQQQQQQGNHAHPVGYDQAVVRRGSGDGSGYVTYNIYSLAKRRSAESGQTPSQTTPEGSTHGGRHVLHHLEGSTHRQPHMAVHFQAVREGLMEGFSPRSAAAALAAAAAGTARRDGDAGGGTSTTAAAAAAAGSGGDDLRQPLLSKEEQDD